MRKGTITEGGKKITWNETATGVEYSDGKVALPSPSTIDAKVAYKTAKTAGPVIVTPVSRELSISDFLSLRDVEGERFTVKPGIINKQANLQNLKNVRIDGLGKVFFQGIGRCIEIKGDITNLAIGGFSSKDISGYQIVIEDSHTKSWRDGAGTLTDGFELFNWHSVNGGVLFHANGDIFKGSHRGLIKNFKMHGCSFKDSPKPEMVVYLGNAMGYDISGNVVDNINSADQDHNGIFMLKGNGKFYGNKVTNHQGNALRSWLFSHQGTQTVEAYNNIVFNSRKYSAIEIQATPDMQGNGFRPANARIFNNTVGRMNTSKDWHGQILDVYHTGGTLEYYNNLGFELNRSIGGPSIAAGITDMINFAGDSPLITRNEGNIYRDNWQDAVTDLSIFKSKHNGVGALTT